MNFFKHAFDYLSFCSCLKINWLFPTLKNYHMDEWKWRRDKVQINIFVDISGRLLNELFIFWIEKITTFIIIYSRWMDLLRRTERCEKKVWNKFSINFIHVFLLLKTDSDSLYVDRFNSNRMKCVLRSTKNTKRKRFEPKKKQGVRRSKLKAPQSTLIEKFICEGKEKNRRNFNWSSTFFFFFSRFHFHLFFLSSFESLSLMRRLVSLRKKTQSASEMKRGDENLWNVENDWNFKRCLFDESFRFVCASRWWYQFSIYVIWNERELIDKRIA